VTMASLSDHLARVEDIELQFSTASETIAQPPPLAGLWDVRRSQLAHRAPRKPADDDLTGSVLPGRFRLDRLVARGTFGTVYRARQLAVERDVAVKVLHADIDPSSEDGKLFVHEIRSVGRIDHSNVVRIYQADITHDGRLFFAMELLDGQDLQSLGNAGKLPKERAVDLVRQLLGGLAAAHDAGLVHADLKPANAIVIAPPETSDGASTTHERAVLVDFGLSRLRAPGEHATSAGGTPAYMAPEQMLMGRVDARSDLFSVSLVLVWMLTGWRRPNAVTLAPPIEEMEKIEDPHLRTVLARALDPDPAKRFQSARELSAALGGAPAPISAKVPQETRVLPFRHLAPLTEADHGRLHGREADVALITEHALYRRVVVYAAPSGTGKTSVLRAGLMPRLEALGIHAVYVRCRTDFTWSVVRAIAPGATSIADAITKFHEQRGGKLVLVIDQIEAALADPEFVPALLRFDHWPAGADVSIVLAIREDWLARLLARTQEIEPNLPIVRLPPLSPEGARTAIVAPLTEHRLEIKPDLLDVLLADLQRAAAAIGPEMGWGDAPAVFPPHLQLACSVLHEQLAVDDVALELRHYRSLGGFDAIVGEHLDRVIETELDDGRDVVARDLFLALVTSANQRAIRPEVELLSIVGPKHGADRVMGVLEVLRAKGLLVRVRADGEASWELVHDSLVARVLAWIDRKDLARRRAIEQIRYHLRRSTK
ncbi:MAG: protein kinase, partial [Deltaproteobacteria bacterium]|nr:protein kinase [Deltaproteobacteria bacterium]